MDASRYFEEMHRAMSAQKNNSSLLLTVKVQDLGGADAYLELRQSPNGRARVFYSTMGRRNLNFQLFRKGWQLCHNASGEMTGQFPTRAENLLDSADFSACIRDDALDAGRTEIILRELRRTALIIPPRGRAVLCCWAAIPGLLAAPFVFWQSLPAGMVFCLLWAALVAVVYQRACSYAAALGAETLTVYSGIVFPLRRAIRRRAVTGLFRLRTPLLRLARRSVVVITAPGTRLILPAVPAEQAAALTHALAEEIR